MTFVIQLTADSLNQLDLTAAEAIIKTWLAAEQVTNQPGQTRSDHDQQISFAIDYPREPGDPRELSEIPEIRLWFVRLDARYPWLPLALDWEAGELGRYTAMLVPHQFSSTEGIQYNPEALELFMMQKVFVASDWMQQRGSSSTSKLKFMTQMLGYELDDGFFELL